MRFDHAYVTVGVKVLVYSHHNIVLRRMSLLLLLLLCLREQWMCLIVEIKNGSGHVCMPQYDGAAQ